MPLPNRQLIQIVPRLTPGRCGVSDHATMLAHELEFRFGVKTTFVLLNSGEASDLSFPVVRCVIPELFDVCASMIEGQLGTILVHMSGYGYCPNGAPVHLAETLARMRASGLFRIAVYFHELFATGAPWKSAFWYSRRQKSVMRTIANLSELVLTNTSYHAAWLQQQLARRKAASIRLLPVFSTVGEARRNTDMKLRAQAMAVFGLPASRRKSYEELSYLGAMLHGLGIERILDVGRDCDPPQNIDGVRVQSVGELPAPEIADLLSKSTFGFMSHPAFCLAKSSIFAAYCAQGLIPVLAKSFFDEFDGLRDGVHVVSPKTAGDARASGLGLCSHAAWRWYLGHSVRVHAETYWRWLSEPS
jgi:hypothetical protein